MPDENESIDKKSVFLTIHYNWPSGKNSISSIEASPNTKIKIFKSDKENSEQLFKWDPLGDELRAAREISNTLSKEASEGSYFTGDIFFIHAEDDVTGREMRARLDAHLKRPANAKGPTSVFTKYMFEM